MKCPTHTSTGGKARAVDSTAPSGVLSPRQITALIQQNKWWPFDRVDGAILVKMNAKLSKAHIEEVEDALL